MRIPHRLAGLILGLVTLIGAVHTAGAQPAPGTVMPPDLAPQIGAVERGGVNQAFGVTSVPFPGPYKSESLGPFQVVARYWQNDQPVILRTLDVASLAPGESVTDVFSVAGIPCGALIEVIVDPQEQVAEWIEWNNVASTFAPACPDPRAGSGNGRPERPAGTVAKLPDLVVEQLPVESFGPLRLRVRNVGQATAGGVPLSVTGGGRPLRQEVPSLKAETEVVITLPDLGTCQRLTVTLDPENWVTEEREDNNSITAFTSCPVR